MKKLLGLMSILLGMVGIVMFAVPGAASAAQEAVKEEKAILAEAPMVSPPITRTKPAVVVVEMEMSEKVGQLKHPLTGEAVDYTFWTFGGTVPGPFFRARVGDTVIFHIKNSPESKNIHSIDLHAVTGQGGGASASQTPPGSTNTFQWKALNPGLYVYHCATADIPTHIANGMYGLVFVQPEKGLPKVDHEYYVVQGDFYPAGKRGDKGMQPYSKEKALDERPEYVLWNAFSNGGKMEAKVGEKVRLFVGNGGPNLTSAFHVIGEIFDSVYPEGAVGSEPHRNIQTTVVPPGGSAIVEISLQTAAKYILVDHAINRAISKGGVAILEVTGSGDPEVYKAIKSKAPSGH